MNKPHPVLACILVGLAILMMPVALQAATPASPAAVETAVKARLIETYGKLSLSFEANQGQTGDQVKFLSRGHGYTLFLTPTEAVLSLRKRAAHQAQLSEKSVIPGKAAGRDPESIRDTQTKTDWMPASAGMTRAATGDDEPAPAATLRMQLVGGNPKPQISGVEELPGKVNYFRGKDAGQWPTNIPTYVKVKYEQVYPGIDLVYYGKQRQLEHDFIIAPGADPKTIRLAFSGANKLAIDPRGDLLLQVAGGEVRLAQPVIYQEIDGKRHEIEGRYVLHHEKGQAHARVGFQVASYNRDRPLVIDPVLAYSSFLGGTEFDFATSMAADGAGNVYVTGHTDSNDFPVTPGAFDTSLAGGTLRDDIFITKFDASGSTLIYSTYLGGGDDDTGLGTAIDSAGNAYVTGVTFSSDFPSTPGTFDTNLGGDRDCFVTKVNPSGSSLVYSTYLGGNSFDYCYGVAVDGAGNVYVTGSTSFATVPFPTTSGAYDTIHNGGGGNDAFVTKFNAAGTALVYSTFLGGRSDHDHGNGIVVDNSGNAYVTGATGSDNFPTTSGVFDATFNGFNSDAFVAKLNASGSALFYSTYLGGAATDEGTSIVVDGSGNAYVTGWTHSTNFPTSPGAFDPNNTGPNPADGFITKLNATGAVLLYSTFLGGTSHECGGGIFNATGCRIAIDSLGNAYVTGPTQSSDFPTTAGALDTTHNGNADAFLTQLNASGTGLLYSTFLGSTSSDISTGIALDTLGDIYLTGSTQQGFSPPFFPTTPGAYDTSFNGSWDAFVVKFAQAPPADLRLTQTDSPDPGAIAEPLVYTLTVTNNGPANATGVTVTDPLLGGVTFVSAAPSQGTCIGTSTVTCALGSLANGASATVTIVVTPSSAGALSNTASVTGSPSDPDPGNNSASSTTTINERAVVPPPQGSCNRSACGVQLTCTLGAPCAGRRVTLFVRARDVRLSEGVSAKASKRIKFAFGVANVPSGQTAKVKLRLTKKGQDIAKRKSVKKLTGVLEIRNAARTPISTTPITIRLR